MPANAQSIVGMTGLLDPTLPHYTILHTKLIINIVYQKKVCLFFPNSHSNNPCVANAYIHKIDRLCYSMFGLP